MKAEFEAKLEAELAKEADEAAAEGDEGDEGAESPEKQEKERPQFDEAAVAAEWDEANPPIKVPEEVVDDIDNDYDVKEGEVRASAADKE